MQKSSKSVSMEDYFETQPSDLHSIGHLFNLYQCCDVLISSFFSVVQKGTT
jgi:hypothetical protein